MTHTTLQGAAAVQFSGKPLFNNEYAEAFLWMCISPESGELFNLSRTFLVEFNASAAWEQVEIPDLMLMLLNFSHFARARRTSR